MGRSPPDLFLHARDVRAIEHAHFEKGFRIEEAGDPFPGREPALVMLALHLFRPAHLQGLFPAMF